MPISIDLRPELDFMGNGLLRSKWSCSQNPIVFHLQRMDHIINTITGNGNPDEIVITTADLVTMSNPLQFNPSLTTGDTIYVNARGYVGVAEVLSITGGSGSDYVITAEGLTFIGNIAGGYFNINTRVNYFVTVEVYGYNHATGIYEVFGSQRIAPDSAGLGIARVNKLLNKYMKFEADPIAARNELNINVSSRFYITTTEVWIGSNETLVSDSANEYYFINAVKQIGETYGSNLADYIPFAVDTAGNPKAKWLTDFERPSWFVGHDVDFSIIKSDSLDGHTMTLEQEYQNGLEAAIGAIDVDLDILQSVGVHRISPIGALSGDDPLVTGTKFIDIWLEVDGISQSRYVQEDYVADDYAESLPPSVTPVTPYRVTNKLKIKVKTACAGPLFRWVNSKGGWDRWRFSEKQFSGVETENAGSRNVYADDIEDSFSVNEIISKASRQPVKVFTKIEQDDVSGFVSLFESPCVQIYNSTLSKYQTVELQTKSFQYNNLQSLIPIELVFTMPERNTVKR